LFQPDVELQSDHYFKGTYLSYFCSPQGTAATFNHGINHSSNI